MRKSVLVGLMVIIIVALIGTGWYFNRTSRDRTDINHQFPLRIIWETDLAGELFTPLAYQDNRLFVGRIYSFWASWYGIDANSGKIRWSKRTGRVYLRCLLSELMVLSSNAGMRVLQLSDGKTIWSSNYAEYTATCNKDVVYGGGVPRDPIRAYDLYTGERFWSSAKAGMYGLVYNPQTQELVGHADDYYIIDVETGRTKRSFSNFDIYFPDYGDLFMGPILLVDQGELFSGGIVQDAQTGELIYKDREGANTKYPPALTPNTMYISARDVGIVAYEREGYEIKWVYQPQPTEPLNPLAPIAILDNIGYAVFSDTTVRAFELETGQEIGYWQPAVRGFRFWCINPPFFFNRLGKASLVTSDTVLFVSFGDGRLYAFQE